MKTLLLVVLMTVTAGAATIEDSLLAAQRQIDSLKVVTHTLGSGRAAVRLDSICQADTVLNRLDIHIVRGKLDSMWVRMILTPLSPVDRKLAWVTVLGFDRGAQKVTDDTLYLHKGAVERVIPLLSETFKYSQ